MDQEQEIIPSAATTGDAIAPQEQQQQAPHAEEEGAPAPLAAATDDVASTAVVAGSEGEVAASTTEVAAVAASVGEGGAVNLAVQFPAGSLTWVQLPGYPWWPALTVDWAAQFGSSLDGGAVGVQFYSTWEYAVVTDPSMIAAFDPAFTGADFASPGVLEAYEEAKRAYDVAVAAAEAEASAAAGEEDGRGRRERRGKRHRREEEGDSAKEHRRRRGGDDEDEDEDDERRKSKKKRSGDVAGRQTTLEEHAHKSAKKAAARHATFDEDDTRDAEAEEMKRSGYNPTALMKRPASDDELLTAAAVLFAPNGRATTSSARKNSGGGYISKHLAALRGLATVEVTVKQLFETKIGLAVAKAAERSPSVIIQSMCAGLLNFWFLRLPMSVQEALRTPPVVAAAVVDSHIDHDASLAADAQATGATTADAIDVAPQLVETPAVAFEAPSAAAADTTS